MNKEDYERFIRDNLVRFQKTYKVRGIDRKELKRSIYDNKNLTDEEKEDFWEKVVNGGDNAKVRKR